MKTLNKYLISIILLITGCGEVKEILKKSTPYEEYTESLKKAGLEKTSLGKEWINAGEEVLRDSIFISLPYREEGYFFQHKTEAASYRFNGKRGEKLDILINTDTVKHFKIFADLFFSEGLSKPKIVASLEKHSHRFSFVIERDGIYLLRLQPELLKGGSYELVITKNPSLAFPVVGKNSNAITSFWGNPRDGGKRKHEGVDIIAPKRTPVIASCNGIISRTGENNLGGKVVWLTNIDGFSLYYAHLDSQLVSPGKIVSTGDTLGLVGNTGNAQFTVPHLHFGIYYFGEGAVDPYPFIKDNYLVPASIKINTRLIGNTGRIKSNTLLFAESNKKHASTVSLNKEMPVEVYGAAENYYKIKTPDGLIGFIQHTFLESIEIPLEQKKFKSGVQLLDFPDLKSIK